MQDDIFIRIFKGFLIWGDVIPEPVFSFFLRVTLLLAIPSLLCCIPLNMGNRHMAVQWLCALVGFFVAMSIPLHDLEIHVPKLRTLEFLLCLTGTLFLPKYFCLKVLPTLAKRERAEKAIRICVIVLFVIEYFSLKHP